MLDINLPEVAPEVGQAFGRYVRASMDNDVAVLNELFWDSRLTTQYGPGENLYDHGEISGFRHCSHGAVRRRLARTAITAHGRDFATANIEFERDDGKHGRQSQTGMRAAGGWCIDAANVNCFEPRAT